jgi:hypothetical protein
MLFDSMGRFEYCLDTRQEDLESGFIEATLKLETFGANLDTWVYVSSQVKGYSKVVLSTDPLRTGMKSIMMSSSILHLGST